jgi:hypothetical protein
MVLELVTIYASLIFEVNPFYALPLMYMLVGIIML